MSQALRDLPDPTQPAPVLPAANADDLLAKMADEAIDKLLAEADNGPSTPPIKLRQPPVEPVVEKPAEEASLADAAVRDMLAATEPASADVGPSSSPASVAESSEATAETAVAPANPSNENSTQQDEIELPAGSFDDAAAVAAPAAETPPPKDDVKALLVDEIHSRPSPLLLPLRLLNAPFAWLSDRTRQVFGLVGIVTLVPAICAIIYVLYMKKH